MLILAEMRDHFAEAFFPRRSEWAGGALLMLAGVVLSANPELMARSQTQAFVLMQAIFRQETWADLLLACGTIRLAILMINGLWRRSPHMRALSAMLSCFFWMHIALSSYASFGLAFAAYTVFLGLEFSNIIVASRDARTVDDTFAGAKGAKQ